MAHMTHKRGFSLGKTSPDYPPRMTHNSTHTPPTHHPQRPGVANVTEIVDGCYKYCYARNASNRRARPLTKRKYQMITFNTGRTYTEHGQRIAAQRLDSGHIVMVDIDRHIDYIFTDLTPFTPAGILTDYDNNVTTTPHDAGVSYDEYYAVVSQLRAAAGAVKSV